MPCYIEPMPNVRQPIQQGWVTVSVVINFVLIACIAYMMYYHSSVMDIHVRTPTGSPVYETPSQTIDVLNNPYTPPVKTDHLGPQIRSPSTQLLGANYSQIGILKGNDVHLTSTLILPLMGRRMSTKRDKLQYFTISNTGVVNTKLPVRVKGKNCMNEYGCDEIYSGDRVFVEGYNDEFTATIYENATFAYIP